MPSISEVDPAVTHAVKNLQTLSQAGHAFNLATFHIACHKVHTFFHSELTGCRELMFLSVCVPVRLCPFLPSVLAFLICKKHMMFKKSIFFVRIIVCGHGPFLDIFPLPPLRGQPIVLSHSEWQSTQEPTVVVDWRDVGSRTRDCWTTSGCAPIEPPHPVELPRPNWATTSQLSHHIPVEPPHPYWATTSLLSHHIPIEPQHSNWATTSTFKKSRSFSVLLMFLLI
jgi:hypothetical protein